jgi:uncharacterized membrane protein
MRAVTKSISAPDYVSAHSSQDDNDSLLRRWTPILLRMTLGAAVLLMSVGIAVRVAQSTHPTVSIGQVRSTVDSIAPITLAAAAHGDALALATLGLMVLTLVPLIRVGFCLLFFVRQRNLLYVAMTGYVLAVLTAGIFLGRIG